MYKRLLLIAALVTLTIDCQSTNTQYVKDDVDYAAIRGVFHGRWWNYYERGVNLMRGGFHEAAAEDFRKAIQGRSRDTWQARTYGLHFAEYFPNRELAVALESLGLLDEAEIYLARSLEQIDTARGHHYLDRVKREQIARGMRNDTGAPSIEVALKDRQLVASLDLNLAITASDDTGVYRMKVNGTQLHQRGSRENIAYKNVLSFTEGTHRVTIEAVDLAEKTTTITREIIVDFTGPNIGIREPSDGLVTQAATVRLVGTVVDLNGVRDVSLDGRAIQSSESGEARMPIEASLSLQEGSNKFLLAAHDMAGNETRTLIEIFRGDPDSTSAKLWWIEQRHPEHLQLAAASPGTIAVLFDSLMGADEETAGPVIKLRSPKEGRPWRNARAIHVAGVVTANTQVAKLLINGQEVLQLTGEPKEVFNRRVVLDAAAIKSGSTRIEVAIVADDAEGNQAVETRNIEVRPVELNTKASRMKFAVLAFGGEVEMASLLSDLRITLESLMSQTGRFGILEREQLNAILAEQQLSDTLGDRNATLRLGKIVPAHAFIIGGVIQRGKQAEIHAKVVSTETSEYLIPTVDAMIKDINDIESIRAGCTALRNELEAKLPRVQGEVVRVKESKVWVNWTTEDGVIPGMRFWVVIEEEDIDEDTGEVWDVEIIKIGEAIINNVTSKSTQALQVEREGEGGFETGMAAITM